MTVGGQERGAARTSPSREATPSPRRVEFERLPGLILERLESPGGARAGRGSGTSVGGPRCRWIRCTTDACSISATRRSRPPQRGHVSLLGREPFVAYPFRGRRAAGLIGWPFFQKSRAKFAGSDGEVGRISAFVIARRCFKSARLRLGPSGWRAVIPRRRLLIAHPHFTIIITYDIFLGAVDGLDRSRVRRCRWQESASRVAQFPDRSS
jgi:hypothetical protein